MMKTRKTSRHSAQHKVLMAAAAILLAASVIPAKAMAWQQAENDTSRTKMVVIEGDGPSTTDSMDYVINGKKSTHADFEKIKYSDIMSVNWVSAANAAKIFPGGDKTHNVLFVTTDNSEEGKKMLAKVNSVNNHKGKIFNTETSGAYVVSGDNVTRIKRGDAGVYTVAGNNKIAGEPMVIATAGDTRTISSGSNRPYVYSVNSAGNARAYVSGTRNAYKRPATAHGYGYAIAGGEAGSESELSDLNDKLIVINDKEATAADLKKISAFDIDKMSFKDDDDTRDKYGDKAKNGVVYIYTKKAKK